MSETHKKSHQYKLISVVHGPNLNLLGQREPHIYGTETLEDINRELQILANQHHYEIQFFQSNHEGQLIDFIQQQKDSAGFVVNLGAYTHTSIALRDTLLAIHKPFVEVHLSNPKSRESYRHHSYFEDIALAVCSGKKSASYYEGFVFLVNHLKNHLS